MTFKTQAFRVDCVYHKLGYAVVEALDQSGVVAPDLAKGQIVYLTTEPPAPKPCSGNMHDVVDRQTAERRYPEIHHNDWTLEQQLDDYEHVVDECGETVALLPCLRWLGPGSPEFVKAQLEAWKERTQRNKMLLLNASNMFVMLDVLTATDHPSVEQIRAAREIVDLIAKP